MTNLHNTKNQEQKATLIVGSILLVVAAWNVWQERSMVYWLTGTTSVILILAGLFSRTGSRKFFYLWMRLGNTLGYINSRILLSVVYFLIITPYGITLRLFGRDSMRRRKARKKSYWIPRSRKNQTRQQFERLF